MAAVEETARARGLPEVRVGVRASLPTNLHLYENLGDRAWDSRAYPTGADFAITLRKRL
jgi:hypothetical protein